MKKVTIQGNKKSGLPKSYAPERIEIGDAFEFDCLDKGMREGFEFKIREIEEDIESILKSCKQKMDRSKDDYNNVIKSKKAQHLDELTKLKFKKIEAEKQNTREDFLSKLKVDLVNIKAQVSDKDRELQGTKYIIIVISIKYRL